MRYERFDHPPYVEQHRYRLADQHWHRPVCLAAQ